MIGTTSTHCYNCQLRPATLSNGTFCQPCAENPHSWNPSDLELLARLGRGEVRLWRAAAWEAMDLETVDLLDASGITGLSRWKTLEQRAKQDGVSTATIRRAMARGLEWRRIGRRLEVSSTQPLPATQPPGPRAIAEALTSKS
jgi:hypothetical protein